MIQDIILNFFKENDIDVQASLSINRRQFAEMLIVHDDNIPKIRGAANKVWDRLNKYDFHT